MITMKKTRKSPLNDQAKLKILCDDLCDNIEDLLDHFGLEYKSNGKMISMSCPIHGGDNVGAINLYVQGDSYRGNWKCRTHGCEKIFKGSIIGFVRGLMSTHKYHWEKNGDDTCSFKETIDFVTGFLKKNFSDIKVSRATRNKQQFSSAINHIKTKVPDSHKDLPSRQMVRSNLAIPAQYYMDRGFTADILNKYDIGLCTKSGREMSDRVVAPIYDMDHHYMIGCTGRSIFEKCDHCKCFHSTNSECPEDHNKYLFSKWKHSANFKSQNCLYNIWYAKSYIQKTGYVILVESPGNVWRLEEAGIHNSVAMFGCNLSDRQKIILDSSGAMSIIILTDNDEAGKKAAEQITQKCQNTYRIFCPSISKQDVGEMTIEEINNEIKQYIERII